MTETARNAGPFVSAPAALRGEHEKLLLDLTQVPTAAGREHRVIDYITSWAVSRDDVRVRADTSGNLVIEHAQAADPADTPPLFITAHLDHPAFVIERVAGAPGGGGTTTIPAELHLSFRGGVHDAYFDNAGIVLFTEDDRPVRATIVSTEPPGQSPDFDPGSVYLRTCVARLDERDAAAAADLRPGDVGRWDLGGAAIEDDPRTGGRVIRTDACDDLAPLAAALAAFDQLRAHEAARHVRLLLTRAEEVGFVGAIAACESKTMPEGSRAVLLEASRAFPESPIGGGPIVRVGDRSSTFSPELTAAISSLGELLTEAQKVRQGGEAKATRAFTAERLAEAAAAFADDAPAFRVQRKLMPGGVCESSAYLAYGYESTCVCLPLGNYHNMADLTAVADEKDEQAIANAKPGREFVSIDDFHNLVTLLTAVALSMRAGEPMADRLHKLLDQRRGLLDAPVVFPTLGER